MRKRRPYLKLVLVPDLNAPYIDPWRPKTNDKYSQSAHLTAYISGAIV